MAIDIKRIAAAAVVDRPPVAAAIAGTRSPAAGNGLPPAGEASPPAVHAPDLAGAVAVLNRFLADSQRSFRFQVDDATGETIVRILNPETGEIVRQIPSEDVLAAAHALRDSGSLISARA